jgi:prepilin-type processing-associated H-X9-DG protein
MIKFNEAHLMISKKKFSLTELLIVLAIFMILMSLLSPQLRKINDHANRISCSKNLSGIGISISMYLMDNNEVYSFSTEDDGTLKVWDHEFSDYDGRNFSDVEKTQVASPIYPDMARGKEMYACPTDTYERQASGYPRTYSINHTGYLTGAGLLHSQDGQVVKLSTTSDMQDPSGFIITVERSTPNNVLGRGDATVTLKPSFQLNDYPVHDGYTFNYLFADSHVAPYFIWDTVPEGTSSLNSNTPRGMWTRFAND